MNIDSERVTNEKKREMEPETEMKPELQTQPRSWFEPWP